MASGDLAGWLRGRWTVRREINQGQGRFDGTAEFTAGEDATQIWHETGRLRLGGHDGPAYRTLHLAPGPAGGAWQVRFDDGRPFHDLDLRSRRWTAEHLCGDDVYRGEFIVEGPDRLRVTWRVTGPRKDDVIQSVYERAGD
jgi:hypothetical protein